MSDAPPLTPTLSPESGAAGTRAILVVDLAYGDSGKGTIVDFLARRHAAAAPTPPLVVRFNGGPQAAHNVVTPDGRHHTFAQFGSGTFVPGVRTLLSRFALVEPYALFNEAAHLAAVGVPDALARLTIDARCPVITPAHQAANRLRELARGDAAHGTCGMGVGETMADLLDDPRATLYARDLADRSTVLRKLRAARDRKLDALRDAARSLRDDPRAADAVRTLLDVAWLPTAADVYADLARQTTIADGPAARAAIAGHPGTLVFEGAQGVLLDEWFGFHPHTTWSTTTFANAIALLDEAKFPGPRTRLGVLRTYATRHGPGPLVTEDAALRAKLPEPHNADAGWQGRFRVGVFDAVAARYAVAVAGGVDALAVTHCDRPPSLPPLICDAYEDGGGGGGGGDNGGDDALFARDPAGRITDLRVHRPADLAHQERLTRALGRCRPAYTPVRRVVAAGMPEAIRDATGTPVALTSFGPTADEKRVHPCPAP